MSLKAINIQTGRVGANIAGDSREFAIIANGVAVPTNPAAGIAGVLLETPYKLRRPSDAEVLGINADYDNNNKVNLYRHIKEFYRMGHEGRILWITVVNQSVMPLDMPEYAKNMVLESTKISDIGFAFNPDTGVDVNNDPNYEDVWADGINTAVGDALPELQKFAEWCDENDMPLHTILEGRAMPAIISGIADLRNFQVSGSVLNGEKVSVVIGQDWNYADKLTWSLGKNFADVGTFLGCIAAQNWNENPGKVQTMNLTNVPLGNFTLSGISNHKTYNQMFNYLDTLDDNGYIFPMKYVGRTGCWWNDGHCCVEVVLDASGNMNQHQIYYSHAIDESKRALRIAFLDEVKKTVMLDATQTPAKMTDDAREYFNSVGDAVFQRMQQNSLISAGETTTNPDSDLLIAKQLDVSFEVVPTGMVNKINGVINIKNVL